MVENKTFKEISVGDSASISRTLTMKDILLFAGMSGDVNPAHLDKDYAQSTEFEGIIAHGLWSGGLISAVLGTKLPGPGTIYLGQSFNFSKPVRLGDRLQVSVVVSEKLPGKNQVKLRCQCVNQDQEIVMTGEALVIAPTEKIIRTALTPPDVMVHEQGTRLRALIEETKKLPPLQVAVVHPVDSVSLEGAVKAHDLGIIKAILVGNKNKLVAAATEANLSIDTMEIIDAPHSHGAALQAVELGRSGKVQALMKGALHTDEIMSAVVDRDKGLRTDRRISHIYVMDAPAYPKFLMITDAAINIKPDLMAKRDIVQNAIELAQCLAVEVPKVAVLSAVETIYPPIASTIDAAALCKMADRGQIKGGVVDGPLAFDNAISPSAVKTKAINSLVAGQADILLVPDMEAGNMIAKQLDYLGGAVAAGVALGARIPIILNSRSEGVLPRLASCVLASLFVQKTPGKMI